MKLVLIRAWEVYLREFLPGGSLAPNLWDFLLSQQIIPGESVLCTNEQSDVTFFASSVSIQILERVILVGLIP